MISQSLPKFRPEVWTTSWCPCDCASSSAERMLWIGFAAPAASRKARTISRWPYKQRWLYYYNVILLHICTVIIYTKIHPYISSFYVVFVQLYILYQLNSIYINLLHTTIYYHILSCLSNPYFISSSARKAFRKASTLSAANIRARSAPVPRCWSRPQASNNFTLSRWPDSWPVARWNIQLN